MTRFRMFRPESPRRGVTLVEMLVAVALLVLMMSIIVQVFTAATGAVTASRTYQELDNGLRQLDSTVRQDLSNVTARFTPPLNPKDNLGYFEYGENSFADIQGEDADDYLRFTVKAPEGQTFTGRFWPISMLLNLTNLSQAQLIRARQVLPITITSQYAEVIYFLRNGNLYRRVLLVAPDRQSSIIQPPANYPIAPGVFNRSNVTPLVQTSWQGVNDLSAHPSRAAGAFSPIILNTLGDLTNRENRAFSPRFCNDFISNSYGTAAPDGIPDDYNNDSVPDYWPSLYWNALNVYTPAPYSTLLVNEPNVGNGGPASIRPHLTNPADQMPFPYVYPGAYSRPDQYSLANGLGWIHSPDPGNAQTTIHLLTQLNHNPLDFGDSLPAPSTNSTWWGFPTWRETLNLNWLDPYWSPNMNQANPSQAHGLNYINPSAIPAANLVNFLPPMPHNLFENTAAGSNYVPGTTTQIRLTPLLYSDDAGSATFLVSPGTTSPDALWHQSWEDDLIMTGVRSFDIKAYDDAFPGYVDLGWGDDGRLWAPYLTNATTPSLTSWTPYLLGNSASTSNTNTVLTTVLYNNNPYYNGKFLWPPAVQTTFTNPYDLYQQTFAHEGRIPPLVWDGRGDYQYPGLLPNIGDNSPNVVRLRRVWDTWSTDYSNAPATAVNPLTGAPIGPPINQQPVYPSYPPPYPMPLRGIQIQIRVVDPRNERVKVLTIRQDFSDKL